MTLLPSGLVVLSVSPGWAQMLLDQSKPRRLAGPLSSVLPLGINTTAAGSELPSSVRLKAWFVQLLEALPSGAAITKCSALAVLLQGRVLA